MTTPTAPADDALPAELAAALDRMDALLDPALDLLTAGPDSATAKGSRDDMRAIRDALADRASPSRAAVPAANASLVADILKDCCECERPNHWDVETVELRVSDLTMILERHIEGKE